MAIKNVFVMGAGVMGSGIVQVSAEAGYQVTMMDIKDEFVQKGLASIEKSLDRKVSKGTIQESDKASVMSRIKTTLDMKDAKDIDLMDALIMAFETAGKGGRRRPAISRKPKGF